MRDGSRDRFVCLGELLACLDKEAGEEALFFGGRIGSFFGKLAEATPITRVARAPFMRIQFLIGW